MHYYIEKLNYKPDPVTEFIKLGFALSKDAFWVPKLLYLPTLQSSLTHFYIKIE